MNALESFFSKLGKPLTRPKIDELNNLFVTAKAKYANIIEYKDYILLEKALLISAWYSEYKLAAEKVLSPECFSLFKDMVKAGWMPEIHVKCNSFVGNKLNNTFIYLELRKFTAPDKDSAAKAVVKFIDLNRLLTADEKEAAEKVLQNYLVIYANFKNDLAAVHGTEFVSKYFESANQDLIMLYLGGTDNRDNEFKMKAAAIDVQFIELQIQCLKEIDRHLSSENRVMGHQSIWTFPNLK